jgi:hypothetical protein
LSASTQFKEPSLRNRPPLAALLIFGSLALAPLNDLSAAMVQPVALPELVQRSATIVHGTILATRCEAEAGGARIYTYITVSGSEFLKGGPAQGNTLVFRQIGGQVGDQVIYVPGTPRFTAKQEVLLFLTGDDAGGYPQVMGIFQGALHPVLGKGGERRVQPLGPEGGVSLLADSSVGGGPGRSPLGGGFSDFLERIRGLVRAQAKDPRK